MMTFDEILAARHSVRAYADTPVPREHLIAMLEAARAAPSASNSQTWRFIVVTDPEQRARLCAEGMMPVIRNKFMREAPCIIAGCSQPDLIANKLGTGFTGIEYYQIDLGIALEHLVLKATELGLGTCWVGWFREDRVKEILGVPDKVRVLALISVGYAREEKITARSRKPLERIAWSDRWENPLG